MILHTFSCQCVCDNVYAEIEDMIGHYDTKLISDANLPYLVRQMAVHANVGACISIVSLLLLTLLVVTDTVFHQKSSIHLLLYSSLMSDSGPSVL